MSSRIFMITPTTQSVDANGVIPLTTISRRTCQAIQNASNTILIDRPGYYKLDATITFTAPAAGDVSVVAQKNSVNIPGITSSTTVATATTEVNTLSLTGIIRVFPNEGAVTVQLVNTGVAITTSNVALSIIALC